MKDSPVSTRDWRITSNPIAEVFLSTLPEVFPPTPSIRSISYPGLKKLSSKVDTLYFFSVASRSKRVFTSQLVLILKVQFLDGIISDCNPKDWILTVSSTL